MSTSTIFTYCTRDKKSEIFHYEKCVTVLFALNFKSEVRHILSYVQFYSPPRPHCACYIIWSCK